jgi:hydroxymethylpyrimidine pyrophosphatase-like HAD family hydrolase
MDLGLTEGWVVCSNGAVTARLDPAVDKGYEIVRVVTFDPGPALRTIAMELPDALFAVEDLGLGFRVSADFPDGELSGDLEVVSWEELTATPATRVVIRAPGSTPELFHELVERVGLHEVEYAVGWSAWLDLTPGGVSKASALEEVRQHLGVQPHATVAIGDGGNDLQMLRWAARGVAMGHAPEAVRLAADEVTGSIDDDGALVVLRSLLV